MDQLSGNSTNILSTESTPLNSLNSSSPTHKESINPAVESHSSNPTLPLLAAPSSSENIECKMHVSHQPFLPSASARREERGNTGESNIKPNSSSDLSSSPQGINFRCICEPSLNIKTTAIQCTKCGCYQHLSCLGKNLNIRPYECPACLMAKLDPLLPITPGGVLFGPRLVPRAKENYYSSANRTSYEFAFDLQQHQLNPYSKRRIFVRCLKLDGSVNHSWPLCGRIFLNGRLIENFQFPKDLVTCKRKDLPVLIDPELCIAGTNKILIIRSALPKGANEMQKALFKEDEQNSYAFTIIEVERLSVDQLVSQTVKSKATVEESRKTFMEMVRKQCNDFFEDCVCAETSLRISCADPYLPTTTMAIPAFGAKCKHAQRFDLRRFVQMNERVRLWKCPYCNQKVSDIKVDSYYEAFLASIRSLSLDCPEVYIDRSGKFTINGKYEVTFEGGKFSIKQNAGGVNTPTASIVAQANPEEQSLASKTQAKAIFPSENIIIIDTPSKSIKKEKEPEEKSKRDAAGDSDDVIIVSEQINSKALSAPGNNRVKIQLIPSKMLYSLDNGPNQPEALKYQAALNDSAPQPMQIGQERKDNAVVNSELNIPKRMMGVSGKSAFSPKKRTMCLQEVDEQLKQWEIFRNYLQRFEQEKNLPPSPYQPKLKKKPSSSPEWNTEAEKLKQSAPSKVDEGLNMGRAGFVAPNTTAKIVGQPLILAPVLANPSAKQPMNFPQGLGEQFGIYQLPTRYPQVPPFNNSASNPPFLQNFINPIPILGGNQGLGGYMRAGNGIQLIPYQVLHSSYNSQKTSTT